MDSSRDVPIIRHGESKDKPQKKQTIDIIISRLQRRNNLNYEDELRKLEKEITRANIGKDMLQRGYKSAETDLHQDKRKLCDEIPSICIANNFHFPNITCQSNELDEFFHLCIPKKGANRYIRG